jgi:hypothetical protein
MSKLILLKDSLATAITNDLDVLAVIKFMSTKNQLLICQLVLTLLMLTFEPDLP